MELINIHLFDDEKAKLFGESLRLQEQIEEKLEKQEKELHRLYRLAEKARKRSSRRHRQYRESYYVLPAHGVPSEATNQ